MKPKFVLFRPKTFHNTAEQFFVLFKTVLKNLDLEWIDIFSRGDNNDWQMFPPNKYIHITWHTKGFRESRWHFNKGPLAGTLEWDSLGYAGYSSFLKRKNLHLNYNDILWFELFASSYRSQRISKYLQPSKRVDIISKEGFVFFPLQLVNDSVMKLSSHNSYQVCCITSNKLYETGLKLVVKIHPKDLLLREYIYRHSSSALTKLMIIPGAIELLALIEKGNIELADCNIHDLLKKCSSVALVNSGVGLESLFYKKPVYSWAPSLYHFATYSLKEELSKEPKLCFQKKFSLESTAMVFSEIMRNHIIFFKDLSSIRIMIKFMCKNWETTNKKLNNKSN